MGDDEYLRCIEADAHGRRSLSAPDFIALGAFIAALAWAVIGFAAIPQDTAVRDQVDLIEVNHYFDSDARPVFDQVIFYEWCPKQCRHQVQAWRLLKSPCQLPRRDYRTGDYSATWQDGETWREVRAVTVRETWTQWDMELVERSILPKESRRDLANR